MTRLFIISLLLIVHVMLLGCEAGSNKTSEYILFKPELSKSAPVQTLLERLTENNIEYIIEEDNLLINKQDEKKALICCT